MARRHGFVRLLAHVNATFSVALCAKGRGSASCQTVESHTWQAVRQHDWNACCLLHCFYVPDWFFIITCFKGCCQHSVSDLRVRVS